MGLDMYLYKRIYIGGNYDFRDVTGKIEIMIGPKPIKFDLSKVVYITEEVTSWRKANQIHKWFVDNIQNGDDDCKEYCFDGEKLKELRNKCEWVLKNKELAMKLLPPMEGFFFGSYELDECYFEDLKHTVEVLKDLDPNAEYCYHSSW
jgi:hypothetical protein